MRYGQHLRRRQGRGRGREHKTILRKPRMNMPLPLWCGGRSRTAKEGVGLMKRPPQDTRCGATSRLGWIAFQFRQWRSPSR